MERFDVIISCPCGHCAVVQAEETPEWLGLRFVCSKCGSRSPEVKSWPIWVRAFRGTPTVVDGEVRLVKS